MAARTSSRAHLGDDSGRVVLVGLGIDATVGGGPGHAEGDARVRHGRGVREPTRRRVRLVVALVRLQKVGMRVGGRERGKRQKRRGEHRARTHQAHRCAGRERAFCACHRGARAHNCAARVPSASPRTSNSRRRVPKSWSEGNSARVTRATSAPRRLHFPSARCSRAPRSAGVPSPSTRLARARRDARCAAWRTPHVARPRRAPSPRAPSSLARRCSSIAVPTFWRARRDPPRW